MNHFIDNLGTVCFIFWGIIGLLLIWYVCKIKEFNANYTAQEEQEGDHKIETISGEDFEDYEQNHENHDHQNETSKDTSK